MTKEEQKSGSGHEKIWESADPIFTSKMVQDRRVVTKELKRSHGPVSISFHYGKKEVEV